MASLIDHKSRLGVEFAQEQTIELGASEHAMAKVSLLMKGNMRPTIVAILEGHCPAAVDFEAARDKLAERHPVLSHKVVQRAAEPPAEPTLALQYDAGVKIPIAFHNVPLADDTFESINESWKSVFVSSVEKKPLVLNEAIAQIDVVSLVETATAEPKTAVLFTCEHALCDGMSLSQLIHELLALLAGEDLPPSVDVKWSAPLEVLCAPASAEQGQARLASFMTFPQPTTLPIARFPTKNPQALPTLLVDTCSTNAAVGQLDAAETARLVELCRQHEVTVTGVVGAAMMQAAAGALVALAGETPLANVTEAEASVVLSCAADTRRLYSPPLANSVLACHVSGVASYLRSLKAYPGGADELWAAAVDYRKHLSAVISGEFPLFVGPFLSQAWAAPLVQTAPGSPPLTLSISNWGVSPVQSSYGDRFKVLSVLPTGNLSAYAFPGFLMTTAVGKLTLACHTPSGPDGLDDSIGAALVADILRLLRSLL